MRQRQSDRGCKKRKGTQAMEEKSKVIFGNPMPDKVYRKAVKSKKKYAKKFGDDAGADFPAIVKK